MDLFSAAGVDLGSPSFDGPWEVRRVNTTTAERWLAAYHYLGARNPTSVDYGVFCPDMIALVSVGSPANEHGIAKRYELAAWPGNREITRVAVHPDAPTNTASRAVAAVMEQVAADGYDWVFSYADTGQDHHGGIYQALNAVYVGISDGRPGWLLDGKQTHPRTIVSMFGTQANGPAQEIAAKRGHRLEYVPDLITPKHTYVLPISRNRATRFRIRRHLQRRGYARPYPKRATLAA